MKKIAIAIIVTLAGFATVAQTAPKDNTWYTGGRLGYSKFRDTAWYNNLLNNDNSNYKNQLGAALFGGYWANPYIGFEMGYDWLGCMPYKSDTINGTFKAQGVQLAAKLDYPISDNLDMYTRFGGMIWHADSSNSVSGNKQDTGISPVLAGGIEWAATNKIGTRLEYQWISSIGDDDTVGVRPNNSMLSVGVSYRFGQREVASVVTSAPEVQNKHFALKSDILFNFNEASLKLEGQQTLDQLCSQLNSLEDPKDISIVVLGFADRIGSDTYNQSLSEERTHSVVDYLISKGIQSSKISVRGMGKSNPITGNVCDNVKARTALINCLAPDRRVEIEVKNVKSDVITQPTV